MATLSTPLTRRSCVRVGVTNVCRRVHVAANRTIKIGSCVFAVVKRVSSRVCLVVTRLSGRPSDDDAAATGERVRLGRKGFYTSRFPITCRRPERARNPDHTTIRIHTEQFEHTRRDRLACRTAGERMALYWTVPQAPELDYFCSKSDFIAKTTVNFQNRILNRKRNAAFGP